MSGAFTRDAYFTGSGGVPLGEPFVGVPLPLMGISAIEVNAVRTNIIRLNVTSSWGNGIGASEIFIQATVGDQWIQPTWSSNSNGHGTITASSSMGNNHLFGAFNGFVGSPNLGNSIGFSTTQWQFQGTAIMGTSGWLQLTLNYYINVHSIVVYNAYLPSHTVVVAGQFTGTGGRRLGEQFEMIGQNLVRAVVEVGGVRTNVIRLQLTTPFSRHILGVSQIIVHATV